MIIKSPGLQTDLIYPSHSGLIIDRGEYLVIKSPKRPNFFWGNYLVMPEAPRVGELDKWRSHYNREFDSASQGFMTFAIDADIDDAAGITAFTAAGFSSKSNVVLTAKEVLPPSKVNSDVVVRELICDEDWAQVVDVHKSDDWYLNPDSQIPFLNQKVKELRELSSAKLGCRFGAFLGDKLVADLGIYRWNTLGRVSLADIYVRLKETKYIKVARINSELSLERIQAYKAKGLHFLFIRKEDFARYVGLNVELTKKIAGKKNVSRAQRFRLMKHTSEILLQEAYVNGVDKQKMQATAALVEAMVSALSEDQDIFKLIEILQTHSDHLYAHSLGVSLYSAMIAKEVGWTSAPTLFKITMGGLLHDIGKKEIDPSILNKHRQDLSKDERGEYETHPIRGKQILSLVKSIPEDVAQIALHHHENMAGRGFPFRLLKSKIHPLAKVVALANEFCDLVLKSSAHEESLTAHEALKQIYALNSQEVDLALLRALMTIFNFPIPADMPKSSLPDLG